MLAHVPGISIGTDACRREETARMEHRAFVEGHCSNLWATFWHAAGCPLLVQPMALGRRQMYSSVCQRTERGTRNPHSDDCLSEDSI